MTPCDGPVDAESDVGATENMDAAAKMPKDDVFGADSVVLVGTELVGTRAEEVVAGRKIGIEEVDTVLLCGEEIIIVCVPFEIVDNAMLDLLAAIAVERPSPGGVVAFAVKFETASVESSDRIDVDAFAKFEL